MAQNEPYNTMLTKNTGQVRLKLCEQSPQEGLIFSFCKLSEG